MCYICAAGSSTATGEDPLALFDQHLVAADSGSTGAGTVSAPYTLDQVAGYLTQGYWNFNGESWRAFSLGADRVLTYDVSRLSAAAASIATAALNAWAAVTGITFVNIGTGPTSFIEGADVGGWTGAATSISTNTIISGTVGSVADQDWYRVSLVAGQTYVFSLASGSIGSGLDGVLQLLDAAGNEILSADSASSASAGEYITYTATSSGTFYVVAGPYGSTTGGYELSVQRASDLTFNDADDTGAYAWSDLSGNTILQSYINVADNWSDLNLNGYMFQTYIHEIGHALGLGHAGPYNGDAVWGPNTLYDNDSWSTTVMSYFDQDTNTFDPAAYAYLASVMPADVVAIQNLYGAGAGYQTGNTIWGPGGTVGGSLQNLLNMWAGRIAANPAVYVGNPFAFMVYDTAGTDTLDFSAFGVNQRIELTALLRSNVGGGIGNMVIARGTVIENATGGSGADTLVGNSVANLLKGNGGLDSLYGGASNDVLVGGTGADRLDGGEGSRDRAQYNDAGAGLRADLQMAGTNTGIATGDVFAGIEDLYGSNFGDSLLGNGGANMVWGAAGNDLLYGRDGADVLYGGDGNDVLFGGNGADRLDGGAGTRDRVQYSDSAVGLRVDLQGPASNTGSAVGDVFVGIEDLQGSVFGDTLLGDAQANIILATAGNDLLYGRNGADALYGGDGNDVLLGGSGADRLDGGAGTHDRVQYNDETTGIRVDLQLPNTNTGFALGDVFVGIEDVQGSNFNDTLLGNAGVNMIWGGAGNDVIYGRDGGDAFVGGLGNDTIYGGVGADVFVLSSDSGRDLVADFSNGIDRVDLTGALSFAGSVRTAVSGGVAVTFAGVAGLSLTLMGVTVAQVDASDFF